MTSPHGTLEVLVVNHYGRETIRPMNDLARRFAELLGQKTLTRLNVEAIKHIGFTVMVKSGEVTL